MDRRAVLTEGALDYVMSHGLIGLSLRPLAAALGTSDRMLIYHFGSKEQLIRDILALAQQNLVESMAQPVVEVNGPGDLIRDVWKALKTPAAAQVTRLYLETCALAVRDPEAWGDAPGRFRAPWKTPLLEGLLAFGINRRQATAMSDLILDTLDGLSLDRLASKDPKRVDAAAAAFANLLDQGLLPPD